MLRTDSTWNCGLLLSVCSVSPFSSDYGNPHHGQHHLLPHYGNQSVLSLEKHDTCQFKVYFPSKNVCIICNCFSSACDGITNQFKVVLKIFIIMGIPWICDFFSKWLDFNLGGFHNYHLARLSLDLVHLTGVTFSNVLGVCHHDAVSRACGYSLSWWGHGP